MPLRRMRFQNASRVVQAYLNTYQAMARFDLLKEVAVSIGTIRRHNRRRAMLHAELNKRIAVKREIARKQKEEEDRLRALAKIESDMKEARECVQRLMVDDDEDELLDEKNRLPDGDLQSLTANGALLVDVINKINPNFKVRPVRPVPTHHLPLFSCAPLYPG
jgi:hypothetical protein